MAHGVTAVGAVFGFLALRAVFEGDIAAAFMWLGLALVIDGVDGGIARRARVSEVIPWFDGATLDNIIDYFTYVAVPAAVVYRFAMVPEGWAAVAAATMMAVSCYTFSNKAVKTSDYYFSGFPAIWNIVVFYLYVLQTAPIINLLVVAGGCLMTFLPFKYIHPFRVRQWRPISIAVTLLWVAASVRLVLADPESSRVWTVAPAAFWLWVLASVYFAGLSLWRSLRGRPIEE